jgi:ribose transport system permease protein
MPEQKEQISTVSSGYVFNRKSIIKLAFKYNAVLLLIILVIAASFISPYFLSSMNISNIFRQQSTYMLIALGMLMVMLTGGIDLSVSPQTALSSVMVAYALQRWGFQEHPWGLGVSIFIGIAACFVIGCLNGFMVARLNMPAFIVTLATMYGVRGLAFMITNANTILLNQSNPLNKALNAFAADLDPLLHIPYPVYLAVVVVVIFGLVMYHTSFGRLLTATGSNETAVQLAGINSRKYKFWAYALCGTLCGIAGVIVTARSGSATALTSSGDYDMTTIAGVVIGGASLRGGEGTVIMTVIGVFVLAIISNIMNLVSLAVYPQMIVKAIIIILAVLLKSASSKAAS